MFSENVVSLVALHSDLVSDGKGGCASITVRGSCVTSGKDGLSDGLNVVVADDGSSLNVLDDGLAGNGGGDGVWDGPGNVDGGGDLDDLLDWLDDIIGDIVGPGNIVGLVDNVGLLLDGDDGGVDLGGSTESSGDGNVKLGDGWLENLGGVAGNVGGGSKVNLLADLGWGLVDGGDGGSDDGGGAVGSWGRDGGSDGQGGSDGSVRGGGEESSGWGSTASSGQECEDDQWVHFE